MTAQMTVTAVIISDFRSSSFSNLRTLRLSFFSDTEEQAAQTQQGQSRRFRHLDQKVLVIGVTKYRQFCLWTGPVELT